MESKRPVHRGNTGGGRPPPPTVPPVQHYGAVAFLERTTQDHREVQEGGRAKTMAFGGGGSKGGDLKGLQHIQAPPWDGPVLQIPGESNIGGG